TVGLSQLTTSGQHRPPSLRARTVGPAERPASYRLEGDVPWVTGAGHAGALVTGAVLEDGRQVVLLVPADLPGVSVGPPLSLAATLAGARQRLHALAQGTPAAEEVLELRVECTRLVMRATQAALAVAKGAGFVVPHPAQRWARQAQFFLVWSCPQPVMAALL